jgi:O-acetyl-ADP-ribose deacetylase (regulator of RNase III)
MQTLINHTILEVIKGKITEMNTQAIVNPATQGLTHGGGMAGLIATEGGPTIQEESNEWVRKHGLVPTGSAAITSGGKLKARYVIHTVGPIYDGKPRAAELLVSAVQSALRLADNYELRSVAIPPISTGIFGYPMEEAAHVILRAIIAYLQEDTRLKRVVVCVQDHAAFEMFAHELEAQTGK